MKETDRFFEANQKLWDELSKLHIDSKTYKTKEFLEGKTTLHSIELEELGSVKGKTLLHLQCSFGLDTLSWAREGASVTGVDFSGEAIRLARMLSDQAGLKATFIQSNIYDLPKALDRKFDIVFTSYGVLCWLPDLPQWAQIVARFLKRGGFFYIAEFHPMMWVFDWDTPDGFRIARTYFHNPVPIESQAEASYAEPNKRIGPFVEYEWAHGLGAVVTAIADAGLRIRFLHEFPRSTFQQLPCLKEAEDGSWYIDDPEIQLPLTYSLLATKER